MKRLKAGIGTIIILIVFITNYSISQTTVRPEEIGIKVKQERIDNDYMDKHKSDTLIIGNFNYEDEFPDAAVLNKSKGEIVIYINQRNGTLIEYKRIKEPDCYSIERSIQKNAEYFPRPKDEIMLYNKGKSNRIMNVIEINRSDTDSQTNIRVPQWDVFSDGRVFVYDFAFNQVWQSYRSGQPQYAVALGDIDNDGKNEAVFTFHPINDTFPQYKPSHITVFECYGDNQYRIDWDTLMVEGGYVLLPGAYDFDKNGRKEFFAMAYDYREYFTDGVIECSGEGKYKYYSSDISTGLGNWFDLCYLDSTGFRTTYPVDTMRNHRGFVGLWGFNGGNYSIMGFSYFSRDTSEGGRPFSFIPWADNVIHTHFQVFDIEYGDFDRDTKNEIVISDNQFGTNYINYLDSTGGGPSWQGGWEVKTIIPNAPISAGFITSKDYDNDGYKEITVCGIGHLSGSIGTVKHTGAPGANQFTTVFWDSAGIGAGPNNFIDTGIINNKFVVLYPYYWRRNSTDYYTFITYSRLGVFDLYSSSYKTIDSSGSTRCFLIDMDKDNKNSIIAAISFQRFISGNSFLTDFESNTTIGIHDPIINIPREYILYQNYPNPFNSSSKLKYEIAKLSNVRIVIYDITGREVQTLVNETLKPGLYETTFDGSKLSSGIYFYSLIVEGKSIAVKKMAMVK